MTLSRENTFPILCLLGILSVVTPFAIDLYLPAFEQMAADLRTTSATVSLSLSSYFIGLAFGQVIYGPLLDRFGRKRPIYAGLAIFCLASLGCMFTHNVFILIALRLLQGFGGCAAQVGAISMVHDFFPVEQSAKIFSLLFLFIAASPLFAPSIGSLLTAYLGWRWVFVFMFVLASATLAAIRFLLPEGHQPDAGISLKPSDITATYLGIFENKNFQRYAITGAFSLAGLFTYVAGASIMFMGQFGVGQKMFGALFALLAVGFIGASQLNVALLKRHDSAAIFAWAIRGQVASSLVLLVCAMAGILTLGSTVAMLFVILACVGLSNPNGSALALAPFSREAGSASALLGLIQLGAGALISTTIGVVGAKDSLPIIATLFATSALGLLLHTAIRPRETPEIGQAS
jgi:DHA1 family bicyclomycin/chloramphenicol resistance-like MFS transporter